MNEIESRFQSCTILLYMCADRGKIVNAILSSPGLANLNPHQENQRARRHVCSGTYQRSGTAVLYQQKTHTWSQRNVRRGAPFGMLLSSTGIVHIIVSRSCPRQRQNVERHVLGARGKRKEYVHTCRGTSDVWRHFLFGMREQSAGLHCLSSTSRGV